MCIASSGAAGCVCWVASGVVEVGELNDMRLRMLCCYRRTTVTVWHTNKKHCFLWHCCQSRSMHQAVATNNTHISTETIARPTDF
jgi:hypothetical protein